MTNSTENGVGENSRNLSSVSRRTVLGMAATTAAFTIAAPSIVRAQSSSKMKMAFSTPFTGQDSFSGMIGGINGGAKDFDVDMTIVDAAFDVKKQNDQIATLIASKPDALLVLAFDPLGSSNSVAAAVDAGIPVFLVDSYVPNAVATTCCTHDNFGMGRLTAQHLAERLGGKGKIGVMKLGFNEYWSSRHMGMYDVLKGFPDIEVIGDWSFDATGKTTARTAAEGFLAAHPDLDAIWCAWDNAAMEASLAGLTAGRSPDNFFTTGIDGGKAAFEVLRSGGPFSFTVTQNFYTQAYDAVKFAVQHLNGESVPRIVLHPSYAVTKEMLDAAGERANEYDKPGVADELGWTRVL